MKTYVRRCNSHPGKLPYMPGGEKVPEPRQGRTTAAGSARIFSSFPELLSIYLFNFFKFFPGLRFKSPANILANIPVNIPNVITALRLAMLAGMWFYFAKRNYSALGTLLLLAGISDILDGFLARWLRQETPFGAGFDSFADSLIGLSLAAWVPFVFPAMLSEHAAQIIATIALVFAAWLLAALKFRSFPAFHLWSNKTAALLGYLFIIHALIYGYSTFFLYLSMLAAWVMSLEEIAVTLTSKSLDVGRKSFFAGLFPSSRFTILNSVSSLQRLAFTSGLRRGKK